MTEFVGPGCAVCTVRACSAEPGTVLVAKDRVLGPQPSGSALLKPLILSPSDGSQRRVGLRQGILQDAHL